MGRFSVGFSCFLVNLSYIMEKCLKVCVIEDKIAAVVVASYAVSRNPVRFGPSFQDPGLCTSVKKRRLTMPRTKSGAGPGQSRAKFLFRNINK